MSDEIKPIRAWAEYDEWSMFWDETGDVTGIPKDVGNEALWSSGGIGMRGVAGLIDNLTDSTFQVGPLRSLRVLLSGWDGNLMIYRNRARCLNHSDTQPEPPFLPAGSWTWNLFDKAGARSTAGWFAPETTDAEAVERALSEAIAYFAAQETTT